MNTNTNMNNINRRQRNGAVTTTTDDIRLLRLKEHTSLRLEGKVYAKVWEKLDVASYSALLKAGDGEEILVEGRRTGNGFGKGGARWTFVHLALPLPHGRKRRLERQ